MDRSLASRARPEAASRPRRGVVPRAIARLGLALLVLGVAGCESIGAVVLPRDRVDYSEAVAESWKEQTLLNIVRLRYGDAPTFLDVSSVITAYALGAQATAGTAISSDRTSTIPYNLATVGGTATYLDRPTISYTPLAGDKFTKSLLRPLPPNAIFELIQAGYPADFVLQVTTRSINGLRNRSSIGGVAHDADPTFYTLLDTLRRLQLSGSVSLRLEKQGRDEVGHLVVAAERSPQSKRDLESALRMMNVKPDRNDEITITFGAVPRTGNELAVLSRSMIDILQDVAAGIDVPRIDVTDGRTIMSTRVANADNPRDRPFVRILSGAKPPAHAFVAVRYHDTWYAIDDTDFRSKRVFTFLMLFFSLAETGVTAQAPLLTLPLN